MSGSGTGRGRGWLNINNNLNPARPGGVPSAAKVDNNLPAQNISAATSNSQPHQYSQLIGLLQQLNPNDDGILLNQKYKNIIQNWENEFNSRAEVEESCKYIYVECLQDSNFADNVFTMVTSDSFITIEVHGVKILNSILHHAQKEMEYLQWTNPTGFRNIIRMLGEYFCTTRTIDENFVHSLMPPYLCYLNMLLNSAEPADLKLFTSELYLNGADINRKFPQEMENILKEIRQKLVNNVNLTTICKTWLLLSLEVAFNSFGSLSADMQQFYQEKLGDEAIAYFQ